MKEPDMNNQLRNTLPLFILPVILLGCSSREHQQKRAVEAIESLGGTISTNDEDEVVSVGLRSTSISDADLQH